LNLSLLDQISAAWQVGCLNTIANGNVAHPICSSCLSDRPLQCLKTAQTLARSVSKRIAEIKARERERREEKLEASAKKITGETLDLNIQPSEDDEDY